MTAENFFKELQRLLASQPKAPTRSLHSENCDYGSQLYHCKNMLYCFDVLKSVDCTYIFDSMHCVNCMDGNYVAYSELCYESVDLRNCYNSDFLEYCSNVRDSSYSVNCHNCNDIFGCVGLSGKSFCIFNRQLTEAEYKEKIKEYKSISSLRILQEVEKMKSTFPLTQTRGLENENSPYGNYTYNSKNCYMCFDTTKNEDCGYLFDSGRNKFCYDGSFSETSELSYEFIDSGENFNCNYIVWSGSCQDSSYIFASSDLKNCLGCVNLRHKEYCILNRQFSNDAIIPILNKVGQFISNPIVRNMVGQRKNVLQFDKFMDEGKIVIINISKGKLGEENAALLGSMFITKIQQAALSRARMSEDERRDFYFYVDEFQNFATDAFSTILSEARKYHLNLTIAHQYIAQLPEDVKATAFGNVGSVISFAVGGDDAAYLEKEFIPIFSREDLINLNAREMYLKMSIDGKITPPFSAKTITVPKPSTDYSGKIIENSRMKYGSNRMAVENQIFNWSNSTKMMQEDNDSDFPEPIV